jgi:deoxyribose-phosphate aldolase
MVQKEEIEAINNRVAEANGLLKLILETSELTQEQVKELAILANNWGVDFIKTSSGFASKGAEAEKVRTMREYFKKGVKVSGGIKKDNIYQLLEAASGRDDEYIDLDPNKVRIGESSLLEKL